MRGIYVSSPGRLSPCSPLAVEFFPEFVPRGIRAEALVASPPRILDFALIVVDNRRPFDLQRDLHLSGISRHPIKVTLSEFASTDTSRTLDLGYRKYSLACLPIRLQRGWG